MSLSWNQCRLLIFQAWICAAITFFCTESAYAKDCEDPVGAIVAKLRTYPEVFLFEGYSIEKQSFAKRIPFKTKGSDNKFLEELLIQFHARNSPTPPEFCLVAYNSTGNGEDLVFFLAGRNGEIVMDTTVNPNLTVSWIELKARLGLGTEAAERNEKGERKREVDED